MTKGEKIKNNEKPKNHKRLITALRIVSVASFLFAVVSILIAFGVGKPNSYYYWIRYSTFPIISLALTIFIVSYWIHGVLNNYRWFYGWDEYVPQKGIFLFWITCFITIISWACWGIRYNHHVEYRKAAQENKILEANANHYNISVSEYLKLKSCIMSKEKYGYASDSSARRLEVELGVARQIEWPSGMTRSQSIVYVCRYYQQEWERNQEIIRKKKEAEKECFKKDSIQIVKNSGYCFESCDDRFMAPMTTKNQDRKNYVEYMRNKHKECEDKCSNKIKKRLENSRAKCFQ